MGKIKANIVAGTLNGRVGNIVFYTRNGQKISMAASRSHYHDKRSPEQMTARIRTCNVLNLYGQIKGCLDDNFEGVMGSRNKSTFFRKYNYVLRPVMLDKHQSGTWQSVLAPYVVSGGVLPAIGYEFKDGMFVSDLQVGDMEIDGNTSIDDIVCGVKQCNEFWSNGDNLKVILLKQDVSDDVRELYNPSVLADGLTFCNSDGRLAVKAEGDAVFACAFIHQRGSGQSLSVSTQKLCLSDTTLYDYYTSEEAALLSLKSYKTKGV